LVVGENLVAKCAGKIRLVEDEKHGGHDI